MVELVALVLEYRALAQDREPVRKTLRDVELEMIVLSKLRCNVPPVGRGSFPYVHRDVEDSPAHAPHQFRLAVRRTLEMKPAHDPVGRQALVVLHKSYRADISIQVPLRVRLEEISPGILKNAWFEDIYPFNFCLYDFHFLSFLSFVYLQILRLHPG